MTYHVNIQESAESDCRAKRFVMGFCIQEGHFLRHLMIVMLCRNPGPIDRTRESSLVIEMDFQRCSLYNALRTVLHLQTEICFMKFYHINISDIAHCYEMLGEVKYFLLPQQCWISTRQYTYKSMQGHVLTRTKSSASRHETRGF